MPPKWCCCANRTLLRGGSAYKVYGKDEEGNREKASRDKQRKNRDAKTTESRRAKVPLAEVNPSTALGGEVRMIHNQYSCLFSRASGKSERRKIFIRGKKTDKKAKIHRPLEEKNPAKRQATKI